MTEGFNMDYWHFAKAAKAVATAKNLKKGTGFANPDFRNSVAREPDILRREGSQELQADISKEMLIPFLKTLAGNKDADASHVMEIGHFLYRHCTGFKDENSMPNRPLLQEDRRLMNLACALIEDAFYRGDFLQLPKKQSTAFAFTVNVIAKIFEYPESSEGLKGFNTEKLRKFIHAVRNFEHKSLFPAVIGDSLFGQIIPESKSPGPTNLVIVPPIQKPADPALTNKCFLASKSKVIRLIKRQYLLPYIFKDVLIVRDRVGIGASEKEGQAETEQELASGRFPSDWRGTIEKGVGEHSMLLQNSGIVSGIRPTNYIRLHFVSSHIPFAVWALRYLRSQQKTSSDKKAE